ncbi:DUF5719 family protein [Microbacterium hydrocarbonoxydans]|uniref:DUF5719 family protein n=1 Tax=Microbacterium hydrocarbonoxydans TaxID=273678 RepID=UPI00204190F2|nr:DUF5719 family protein [Microbacterium hydrocarbonoxydans]MCM3779296.1 DUF5719 family protein [Microbacterium hydrocarbonoxydans]
MTGNRAFRVAATSARVVTGALVAAACVVGTVLAISASLPTIAHEPAQADITPLPGDAVLVCNGDFRALGRDPLNSLEMVSAASPRFTSDGTAGTPASTSITADDLVGAGEVRRLVGEVRDRTAPLIAGTESFSLAEDDLFGLAAVPCRPASSESWLIGGTVETGAKDIVVLTNPGAVPSTVSLSVFGTVRASTSVIVPPATQVSLPLSSIASGSEIPIVKVTATGSPVRAVLQSSLTRTLDPAGVDLQDAVAAPQRHAVIPGVQVLQAPADGSEMAVLRLMSPDANTEAVVTMRKVGDSTSATEVPVTLAADQPTEISLASVPVGEYVVDIEAEAPVLTGIREQDGSGPQTDFAWLLPAPEFDDDVVVAVPDGPSPRLVFANDEDEDATVEVAVLGGESSSVTVPAGSSASFDVNPRTSYSLSTSGPVHASVRMTAAGALAGWPVWPEAGAQQTITVYP